jgi:hypothetical protein
MSEDVWATVVVALVSIIGIVITQVWSLRSTKAQFVFQTRASFFQQAFRDNSRVLMYLGRVEIGESEKESIEKATQIIEEHPESFSFKFAVKWGATKDKLIGNPETIRNTIEELRSSLFVYGKKFVIEVLGVTSQEEWKALSEAMTGLTEAEKEVLAKIAREREKEG